MSEKLLEKILAWLEHMGPLFIEAAVILIIGKITATLVIKIMARGLKNKHIDNTAHTDFGIFYCFIWNSRSPDGK